ncbi:amidase [Polynucleobacter antarcticus]|uniref:Amidase n=1 Tax=Polynucleobacter antarcticus TaxID=1743162 RepID=A0A6M9PXQ5_9BURK|nr:amidase [Polynucleobacter antarcticus]QKM62646.1 amidase [Polynucleobacter antarcticus]
MKPALGLVEACDQIQESQLSTKDYLSQCSLRADELEPTLKAFTVRGELPELIAQSRPGPLSGIPVAVKDIIATQGFVTTNGSPIYQTHTPKEDAIIVQKICELGGVIFGKTVTTEFAWRQPGPTTNPWNSAHTPGGSSSGSAAAVASGIVPLAIGSQTVGSLIRPASYCGIVGFKASFGAIPRMGVFPVSSSLDHIGFFTRSVQDVVHAFNLLKNNTTTEEESIIIPDVSVQPIKLFLGNRMPRIAVLKTPYDDLLDQEQVNTLKLAADQLKSAGAMVEDLTLAQTYWDGVDATLLIMNCEAAVVHEPHHEKFPDLLSIHMKELVAKGNSYSANEYIQARNLQKELRHSINEIFERYDAILAAPATGEAPKGLDFTGNPVFCALWSFIGTPAIALPVTKSANGLPLGIQLIGNYKDDGKLLNIASFAESCFTNLKINK